MKRLCVVFLVLCLLFSLAGCRQGDTSKEETLLPTQTNSKAGESTPSNTSCSMTPIETAAVARDATGKSAEPTIPFVSAGLTPQAEIAKNDEGVQLFTYSYQNILIHMPDSPEIATAISDYFWEKKTESDATAADIKDQAELHYSDDNENWKPYSYELKYKPTRIDTKLLSFSGERITTAGEEFSESLLTSVTFSGENGTILNLSDILTGKEMANVLCTMVQNILAERNKTESIYFEDYVQTVQQQFDLNGEETGNWYFTNNGLTFYFLPNDIANSELGPVYVEFTYTQLQGIIKEEFMPEDFPQCSAFSFNAARKDQIQTENFDQIVTVTCDAGGEGVSLFAGATLYNVSVQMGHWTPANRFVDDKVLIAANRLTEKDLLLIYTYIPDVLPNLRLSADCGDGQTRSYYIFQSGKDGSILLINEAE